tara:strand:- start:2944 stop:3120 length:177 start_codon:yes stop_codon:yes gene_type:complete
LVSSSETLFPAGFFMPFLQAERKYKGDILYCSFNPDYVIEFVMRVAIARKSGCLEILA